MGKIILWVGFMMSSLTFASNTLITHQNSTTVQVDVESIKEKLRKKKNLSLSLDVELDLLKQLSQCELGRFLLQNKGLNRYWTDYLILHGPEKKDLSALEYWLLHSAPTVKATRERFHIFQKVLQTHLKSSMKIASIPCGLMNDLLTLDYSNAADVTLVGIDLDEHSVFLAQENAKKRRYKNTEFYKKNAWDLDVYEKYDIITSNGLNIYEPDYEKVIVLYQRFFDAIKPGGFLITSFLTPPPALSKESTWKNVNADDALKQKAIFTDIIGVSWQTFRTEKQTRTQLEKAGFEIVNIIYDSQGIFPTVIARKK